MSDFADLGSDREQEMRDDALERRRREQQKHYAAASAECCAVCEEAIPEARRQALPGVQTCIHCQAELERAIKQEGLAR